jgi:hypothetical protein
MSKAPRVTHEIGRGGIVSERGNGKWRTNQGRNEALYDGCTRGWSGLDRI